MPDLSDAFSQIRELQSEVRRLRSGIQLENSSITDGRMRFIGGLLRVDSGGKVEIVGTLDIDGTTTVTGSFTVTGPWELEGDGTITGDVTITGNVTSVGTFTQNGPWHLNGPGDIDGDYTQTGSATVNGGGKITIQGAGGDVVLDSSYSDPRILLGAANINAGPGALSFNTGGAGVSMYLTDGTIRIPAMATKPVGDVPGGIAGMVWADLAGKFWRLA
ncbi:hypothetical protein ACSS7Z_09910 [Microbacterium sp. A82]|uniref:hypothetical protein n=1 Tax=Microbacterium sp. A82 TaxID=3450452 RepID=UPI003F2AD010